MCRMQRGERESTVSKYRDDDGNAIFLLAEVYETTAGITNHRRLATLDPDHHDPLVAWLGKCEVIGGGDAEVPHSLW